MTLYEDTRGRKIKIAENRRYLKGRLREARLPRAVESPAHVFSLANMPWSCDLVLTNADNGHIRHVHLCNYSSRPPATEICPEILHPKTFSWHPRDPSVQLDNTKSYSSFKMSALRGVKHFLLGHRRSSETIHFLYDEQQ